MPVFNSFTSLFPHIILINALFYTHFNGYLLFSTYNYSCHTNYIPFISSFIFIIPPFTNDISYISWSLWYISRSCPCFFCIHDILMSLSLIYLYFNISYTIFGPLCRSLDSVDFKEIKWIQRLLAKKAKSGFSIYIRTPLGGVLNIY